MADLIDPKDIEKSMKKVPEWEIDDDEQSIHRVFEFDEFMEAIDFVNGVAEIAEDEHHHPDLHIHYATVTVTLTTYDLGGLALVDFEMAGRIDNLVD